MNNEARLSQEEVAQIVGRIDDWKVSRIISSGATAAELREAQAGIVEKGDLEAETERRLSGQVGRLYDILMAGEPEWPERDAPGSLA